MLFLISFIVTIVLRTVVPALRNSLLYRLFANLYLAGTVIYGGGPVFVPLLREYTVAEGWVTPRDFLIALAVIQSFPGPNFNFAVYLGTLAAVGGGQSAAAGAMLGFLGVFAPGLLLYQGVLCVWNAVREARVVRSVLRGFNAAAVGLIYTAIYRLWQVGYVGVGFEHGRSLADHPWWVVVAATSYFSSRWFGLSPPVVIVLGGVMGLIRHGVIIS